MTDRAAPGRLEHGGRLNWPERRFLGVLGLPSLALALGITTVSAFLPVLVARIAGPGTAGALIAMEGLFALFMPSLIGAWSDGTRSRLGPRLPFVLAAGPLMAVALVLMPWFGSLAAIAVLLALFYVAYFTYFSPHFALYLDLVPQRMRGRSQGAQSALREVGLGLALIGGTWLLALDDAAPFVAAAAIVLVATAVFVWAVGRRPEARQDPAANGSFRSRVGTSRELLRTHRPVRTFLVVNALWELALNALRAFVVLYLTVGLGRSPQFASAVLAMVAVAAFVAAPLSGWLADRRGELPLLRIAAAVYAAGALVPAFFHAPWVLAVVPPVAFAAATVMSLPFSVLMGYLPEGEHGAGAGLFGLSRGAGLLAGPLLAGLGVELLDGVLSASKGYGAVFLVASAALAASLVPLYRLPPPRESAS